MFQIFIITVFILSSMENPITIHDNYYGFIFDAGSTGTRLNIFKINKEVSPQPAYSSDPYTTYQYPVVFVKKMDCKVPLNNKTDTKVVIEKIDTCIELGLSEIKENRVAKILWLRFVGTGGLRKLKIENLEKFNELIMNIEEYFHKKGYTLPYKLKFVQVIDGLCEAFYGFISSCYEEGSYNFKIKGTIDIGGSSTQIVLPLKSDEILPQLFIKNSTQIFDHNYSFGSVTFDCGGSNNIRNIYFINIIANYSNLSKIDRIISPCHPNGFIGSIEANSLNNTCTSLLFDKLNLSKIIQFEGNGDFAMCNQQLAKALCHNSNAYNNDVCIFKENPNEHPISVSYPIKIRLLGAWTYMAADFNTEDYDTLVKKLNEMLKKKLCMKGTIDRCFGALHAMFITKSFIKPNDTVILKKIDSGWTLGKMLMDTKYLVSKNKGIHILIAIVVLSMGFSIIMITIFIVYKYSIHKLREFRNYQDQILISP